MNAQDVAHWFLSKAPMTHKKIQKLCYYAQAWYCALYDGTPLFQEEIQAWVHGPVIPALYPKYADYRWNEIPVYNGPLPVMTGDELEVLETVYHTYGSFTGDQLESLTHAERPWQQARGNRQPWEVSRDVISIASMRSFYQDLYDQAQDC